MILLISILMEIDFGSGSNIDDFLNDPYGFIESSSIDDLVNIARIADEAYYNSDEILMSDLEYDMLKDAITDMDSNHEYNFKSGHKVKVDKVKIKLPYCLGSAFKPNAKEIEKFIEKFKMKQSMNKIKMY